MHVLEVSNLSTVFETPGGAARAVNGVSFGVEQGRIMALVGESGSGKSVTALSIMNLTDAPGRIESGQIRLRGEELLGRRARLHVARRHGRR